MGKKKDSKDLENINIQRKFDLIFNESDVENNATDKTVDDNFNLSEDMSMPGSAQKKSEGEKLSIDLDFEATDSHLEIDNIPEIPEIPSEKPFVPDDSGLEFNLEFGDDLPKMSLGPEIVSPHNGEEISEGGAQFELDPEIDENTNIGLQATSDLPVASSEATSMNELDMMFDEAILESHNNEAEKTVLYKKDTLSFGNDLEEGHQDDHVGKESLADLMKSDDADLMKSDDADSMKFDDADSMKFDDADSMKFDDADSMKFDDADSMKFDDADSMKFDDADSMTFDDEDKANIHATIQNIVQPTNFDSTQVIDISSLCDGDDFASQNEIQIQEKSPKISPLGFKLSDLSSETTTESMSESEVDSEKFASKTKEFDLDSIEFNSEDMFTEIVSQEIPLNVPLNVKEEVVSSLPKVAPKLESVSTVRAVPTSPSYISDEESVRVQSTIRQLREEREELLMQIKNLKGRNREFEQDNLTIKAVADESKIEVSILRKRHMVELEDIKYQFAKNEEKKNRAEEKARHAEAKREKLEQRVRIDFNQVKQREKELETKLEMLSIDVESQVHSRDQKILELRRKIDALEFNMENVSIREQKSKDDKRKIEDKLNKIMKTLRHSIKNLEDDIDQANDDHQHDKNSKIHRSFKE